MRVSLFFLSLLLTGATAKAQLTPFEASGGKESATYRQCIAFYKALAKADPKHLRITEEGPTDAGLPLHLVRYNPRGTFDTAQWREDRQLVILINNAIHPGEPDGVDACMLLLRDAVAGKISIPKNVVLAVIPAYNIGGMLNRGRSSRANQNGPAAYGFRGNAQNLDLNRDFTKADSKEASSFADIFHSLDPNIFIDNHVSDGADYQHVMTLLSTQYDKLGGQLAGLMRDTLDPQLYRGMQQAGWPMIPYVNFEDENPEKGWTSFYDPPRYSSGYAALWQCIAYVPETHMLKPFDQRVKATYALLQTIIAAADKNSAAISAAKAFDRRAIQQRQSFPLRWTPDTARAQRYGFLGYRAEKRTSEVTGLPRLFYNHEKPFTETIPIHTTYRPADAVNAPEAYLIPQAWSSVVRRLERQGIILQRLHQDTVMQVTAYHIDSFQTLLRPYEKHYKHYGIHVHATQQRIVFHKGDYRISTSQQARRFLVEMLEPNGEDSYFAWNFFDAVLQQKEGYSDYRWEDVAAELLRGNPTLARDFHSLQQTDTAFAKDSERQLRYIYEHSDYYEPEHLRYPVYRMEA